MRWSWEVAPSFPLNDIVINKMMMEETRFEAVSPGTEVLMLTLQGKCSPSQAKIANSLGHLLTASCPAGKCPEGSTESLPEIEFCPQGSATSSGQLPNELVFGYT